MELVRSYGHKLIHNGLTRLILKEFKMRNSTLIAEATTVNGFWRLVTTAVGLLEQPQVMWYALSRVLNHLIVISLLV